jgi:hypothetical protein
MKAHILILIFFLFAKSNFIDFYTEIRKEISKLEKEKYKEPYGIVFVSDLSCSECLFELKKFQEFKYYGFMISNNPKNFKIKLEKINDKIIWIELNNPDFVSELSKKFNVHTSPVSFFISNSQVNFIPKN